MLLNTFTSTGAKMIHHPVVVNRIKRFQQGTPVSLQIGPTSRCNLNCVFCSNAKRTEHEDIDLFDLQDLLKKLKVLGLKTIEWTGGGDPTMWDQINYFVAFADHIGLEQGMITNGILLKKKISPANLKRLKWLRISMNSLDYFSHVDIPKIKGTLGFSYVMNDKTDSDVLYRMHEHVKKHDPAYVRIVTDCLLSEKEQIKNNEKYSTIIADWNMPYFYQPKVFERSKNCYWGYFKPFLLHDGYVYPCSSVVLNSGSEGKFHEKYRWIKMNDLPEVYVDKMTSFPTGKCDRCVFKSQNDLIEMILNPYMENFI